MAGNEFHGDGDGFSAGGYSSEEWPDEVPRGHGGQRGGQQEASRFDESLLTESQRVAVAHRGGPLLILAGPGSGKTRVVTQRIAGMVADGISPWNLLAITFTNKAANEMADRVNRLLPRDSGKVWVSTFHRFCARELRKRPEMVGLQPNFSIFDSADQKQLVRHLLNDLDIDAVQFQPRQVAARISEAKNEMKSPEMVAAEFDNAIGHHLDAITAKVYPEYQKRLLLSNAVDFDDLLMHMVTLLTDFPEVRAQLGDRYRYVMVDEYQDTNLAQYRIVAALAERHRNLCVTGDPDQSIYGWRGAKIENIMRFEEEFPETKVVRLEQNFRSTGAILQAADQLIAHNVYRKEKRLVTEQAAGTPVILASYDDEQQEADLIARAIADAVEEGAAEEGAEGSGRQYSDFAIFYRVNALSREMERALTRYRVPYQVAGGVAFYDRAEIKDVIAYLRLINNPQDETAFRRIVNVPKRGIGKTTVNRIARWAVVNGMSLFDAAKRAKSIPDISKRAVTLVSRFTELIDELSAIAGETVENTVRLVVEKSGLLRSLENSPLEEDQQRLANIEELITAAGQHELLFAEEASLENFLEMVCLANEVDNIDETSGRVMLMTLHAAKGLEFPVVYILAVEQNLLPHERSIRFGDPSELEEERRLLFVGMTRAMQELTLTETYRRTFRGRPLHTIPSDFVREMELERRNEMVEPGGDSWGRWRADDGGDEEERQGSDRAGMTDAERAEADFVSFIEERDAEHSGDETGEQDGEQQGEQEADQQEVDQKKSSRKQKSSRQQRKMSPQAKVMTGADLLKQHEKNKVDDPTFPFGMTVRHPRYGVGVVTATGGTGKRRTVTVVFRDDGRRETFVVEKSPLQPIGVANSEGD